MARQDRSMAPPLPSIDPKEKGRVQLQELYKHLEHVHLGDRYMAYYGQLRAEEQSHAEALANTVEYFHLRDKDWYNRRFNRATQVPGPNGR